MLVVDEAESRPETTKAAERPGDLAAQIEALSLEIDPNVGFLLFTFVVLPLVILVVVVFPFVAMVLVSRYTFVRVEAGQQCSQDECPRLPLLLR